MAAACGRYCNRCCCCCCCCRWCSAGRVCCSGKVAIHPETAVKRQQKERPTRFLVARATNQQQTDEVLGPLWGGASPFVSRGGRGPIWQIATSSSSCTSLSVYKPFSSSYLEGCAFTMGPCLCCRQRGGPPKKIWEALPSSRGAPQAARSFGAPVRGLHGLL